MKKLSVTLHTIILAMALSLGGIINASAQMQMTQGNLSYMLHENEDKVFEFAKMENKPVLIYINSSKCFSSKKFSREIMNHEKVKSLIRKKYVCMNADVDTKIGKTMASQHHVMVLPAVVLYSPERGIQYVCDIKCDTLEMMTQFRSFLTACNLLEQVKLQVAGGLVTEREALRLIGRSYADKDYTRDPDGNTSQRISIRTLNIAYFKEFETGYNEEWQAMAANKGKKKDFNFSSNK